MGDLDDMADFLRILLRIPEKMQSLTRIRLRSCGKQRLKLLAGGFM
jgi:hypothetical protein